MKLTVLNGLKHEGSEVNLLFYIPLGEKKLHAQFYIPETDEVVYERVIKNWEQATSALLTFRHLNGESIESLTDMVRKFKKDLVTS